MFVWENEKHSVKIGKLIYEYIIVVALITKLCLTLWDSMDCNPPGSTVHGISQARILEWVAISFSRKSSQPRDPTHISCIAGGTLYHCTTWEAPLDMGFVCYSPCLCWSSPFGYFKGLVCFGSIDDWSALALMWMKSPSQHGLRLMQPQAAAGGCLQTQVI